jgi:hypothetical protein
MLTATYVLRIVFLKKTSGDDESQLKWISLSALKGDVDATLLVGKHGKMLDKLLACYMTAIIQARYNLQRVCFGFGPGDSSIERICAEISQDTPSESGAMALAGFYWPSISPPADARFLKHVIIAHCWLDYCPLTHPRERITWNATREETFAPALYWHHPFSMH